MAFYPLYNSPETVMKVFDEHAGIATVPLPRCLCIDEVYVSKYLQTEYACVLLDFDTGAIYDLIPSRKKGELSSYFSNINKGTRNYVFMLKIRIPTSHHSTRTSR